MESKVRASAEQFATLLEFMESHGDLARPQQGAQGRLKADKLWQELTTTLNSVGGGVNRTPEKWKKVWADWKSKTKKGQIKRRHSSGTGGGPNIKVNLTALEERVLTLIGELAVEGHSEIEEQGFNQPSGIERPPDIGLELSIENDMVEMPSPSPPLPEVVMTSTSRQQLTPTPAGATTALSTDQPTNPPNHSAHGFLHSAYSFHYSAHSYHHSIQGLHPSSTASNNNVAALFRCFSKSPAAYYCSPKTYSNTV